MVMQIINVSGLTKYYGNALGIKDVNFSVEQGEIFGFLGPNGAGKTTTIRLMMDLLRPDHGTISIFGIQMKKNQVDLKDRMGYLPGDFLPYSEMTGSIFLNYMTRYRTRPPVLRQSLLDQLQLGAHDLSKKIKQLSHGTRQKVGIVFALEHDPDLVIFDEPTSGLDPLVQEAFYTILRDLQQRGKTVFLSSHILPEVEKVCQRVAIIRAGRIVASEEIEQLKRRRPRRLIVTFQHPVGENPPRLPGARLLSHDSRSSHYLVEGKVNLLLQSLAKLPIKDIVFPEPDLEDVFMGYYSGGKND
jgi:ABC-2 type transport system ATP-binding protein